MTDSEIRKALRRELAAREEAPAFDDTWYAAETRYLGRRRRYRALVGVAAAVAVVAIVVTAITPEPADTPLIEMGELLGSTSWQAPSDVLLPDHHVDLYEELPAFIESTDTGEGALL